MHKNFHKTRDLGSCAGDRAVLRSSLILGNYRELLRLYHPLSLLVIPPRLVGVLSSRAIAVNFSHRVTPWE